MHPKIQPVAEDALSRIASAKTEEELREVELAFLGRKQGALSLLLREVKDLPAEERGVFGQDANRTKQDIQSALAARKLSLQTEEEDGFFDFSVPSKEASSGGLHPISSYIRELEDTFGRMGFALAHGPEVDDEEHNFNALNIPEHHPAREMQDTFWVHNLERHVLRTQTSNMQIHSMKEGAPPFRLIAPGKVFRKDSDATHSPMFHQVEGLMIDKNISLAHLKFVLLTALRELIDPDIDLRFRLSYFPFTEPSLEVDALLTVGKKKRWLEIGGAGMTHPNVLRNVGLDPEEWNGFAFGFGIERQVMIRNSLSDLRLFYENDLRFLEQF